MYEQKNKNQTIILELKNKMAELKDSVENLDSRFNQAEKRISKLEDKSFEITWSLEKKKERERVKMLSLSGIWIQSKEIIYMW